MNTKEKSVKEICSNFEIEFHNIQNILYGLADETKRHKQWSLNYTLQSLYDRMDILRDEMGDIHYIATLKSEGKQNG